jgi:hypothetical protein
VFSAPDELPADTRAPCPRTSRHGSSPLAQNLYFWKVGLSFFAKRANSLVIRGCYALELSGNSVSEEL